MQRCFVALLRYLTKWTFYCRYSLKKKKKRSYNTDNDINVQCKHTPPFSHCLSSLIVTSWASVTTNKSAACPPACACVSLSLCVRYIETFARWRKRPLRSRGDGGFLLVSYLIFIWPKGGDGEFGSQPVFTWETNTKSNQRHPINGERTRGARRRSLPV